MSKKKDKTYDHKKVEKYWREKWKVNGVYEPDINKPDKKFYNLWMFPYPSAEGVHVGTIFASTGSDVFGRYKRMNGFDVFQPIGFDSFGIHSENYAIKINENPKKFIDRAVKNYAKQFKMVSHGYDWNRTVTTSGIEYYKWTQWLFKELFKAGLAYKKSASVNWCPSCKTVLADEQVMTPAQAGKEPKDAKGKKVKVEEGLMVCERCGTVVEKKDLEQWFFRITDYADKLLDNLGKIDWPEKIKIAQTNWIGKKEGINIEYPVKGKKKTIKVWTSRPDTNFGATFIVASPEYTKEHLLDLISKGKREDVSKYIRISLSKSKEDRIAEGKEKTGVFTGLYALNQLNDYEMPIWITDFVLADVGTGCVVGVPGHDERDFDFARTFNLHIRKVIDFDSETHSVVIKKSVDEKFITDVKKNGWYSMDYEDWGYGVVLSSRDDEKYIKTVQKHLIKGPWYVHTDGSLKSVIFKKKAFKLPEENEQAKEYARKDLSIPEDQIDWDNLDNYMFCYTGEGKVVNSQFLNGLSTQSAIKKIMDYLENKGWGERTTNYHLRDWLVCRQRYWGAPTPMIYCETCARKEKSWFNSSSSKLLHKDQSDWNPAGWYPEENLPVELPNIEDFKPEGEGRGPLANHPEFYETKCPACGAKAKRETDVLDTFVDSSWYFLRYPSVREPEYSDNSEVQKASESDSQNFRKSECSEFSDSLPWSPKVTKNWLPVDLYFGGAEHSVLHLMYSRFVTMALNDLGFINFDEPFPWFYAHGLMIKDGAKMSKSRGNVVNPDIYIEKFGADTLRLYLMFMGPMDGYPDFRDTGIEGMRRFIEKVWNLFQFSIFPASPAGRNFPISSEEKIRIKMHQTIKKVSIDLQNFKYNTAIATIMDYVNELRSLVKSAKGKEQRGKNLTLQKLGGTSKKPDNKSQGGSDSQWQEALETLALLLAPFAPHITEEAWVNILDQKFSIHKAKWPKYYPKLIKEEKVTIAVQINGKLRATLEMSADDSKIKDAVLKAAMGDKRIKKWLEGKKVNKEIFVPGRILNLVIN